jgi:hypothetical protein
MKKSLSVSPTTQRNWWIDFALFGSATITSLSGVYFLLFPVSGYQGGRNPYYGIIIFFERHTWGDLHLWGSIAMLIVAAIHIPLHWNWIVSMSKRVVKIIRNEAKPLNGSGSYNVFINALIGISALICGISGLYFLLVPGALHNSPLPDPYWLFSLPIWDLIHTWSGIVMVASAVLHFAIHWKWVTKVTRKVFQRLLPFHTERQGV